MGGWWWLWYLFGEWHSVSLTNTPHSFQVLCPKRIPPKDITADNNCLVSFQIYVRSTDVDRTLMSAYSNLAGLYPPQGQQKWNPNIDWQPIPVHTRPAEEDPVSQTSLTSSNDKSRQFGINITAVQSLSVSTLTEFLLLAEFSDNIVFRRVGLFIIG